MNAVRLRHIFLFLLLLGFGRDDLVAQSSTGAKELFFDPAGGRTVSVQPTPQVPPPSRPPAGKSMPPQKQAQPTSTRRAPILPASSQALAAKSVGLSYWIELVGANGQSEQVSEHRIFHSGERIRLHFLSNVDGYLRLIQTGSSGGSTCLFPDPTKGLTQDRLTAGQERILPGESYWFRFDQNAGVERLVVLFAKDRATLERFPTKQQMNPQETTELLQIASRVQGSKDLVIETETRQASEVGTYAVNTVGGEVVLDIVLQHR